MLKSKINKINESGVTIVTLVITIIILIILVGVTLATLTGDSGILNNAEKAKKENEKAKELENIQVAVLNIQTKDKGMITKNNLEEEFKEDIFGEDAGPWVIKGKYSYYRIDEDGSVTPTGNAIQISSSDYGKSVEYGVEYTNIGGSTSASNRWQVFYSDNYNVYLISKDSMPSFNIDYGDDASSLIWNVYIPEGNSSLPCSILLNDNKRFPAAKKWLYAYIDKTTNTWFATYDKNERKNIQATMYMLDSESVWNIYKNDYADWVIGGPTLEMMVASSNRINVEKNKETGNEYTEIEINGVNARGYPYGQSLTFPCKNGSAFWLATPSSNHYERICWTDSGKINGNNGFARVPYFRPIVCLNDKAVLSYDAQKECYIIK